MFPQSFIGNVQETLDRQSFAVAIFFDLTKAYAAAVAAGCHVPADFAA
jgi:hypothetical protein